MSGVLPPPLVRQRVRVRRHPVLDFARRATHHAVGTVGACGRAARRRRRWRLERRRRRRPRRPPAREPVGVAGRVEKGVAANEWSGRGRRRSRRRWRGRRRRARRRAAGGRAAARTRGRPSRRRSGQTPYLRRREDLDEARIVRLQLRRLPRGGRRRGARGARRAALLRREELARELGVAARARRRARAPPRAPARRRGAERERSSSSRTSRNFASCSWIVDSFVCASPSTRRCRAPSDACSSDFSAVSRSTIACSSETRGSCWRCRSRCSDASDWYRRAGRAIPRPSPRATRPPRARPRAAAR